MHEAPNFKTRYRLTRLSCLTASCLLLAVFVPRPAAALFHIAEIGEVMTSYGGDPEVQFVEIKQLLLFQNFVTNSVLGAFDENGNYIGDVLIIPEDVANDGDGVPWIMATEAFANVSGLTPDFIMPAGLPTGGGMVCWGAPGAAAPPPNSWDHTLPENYVDCLAYGTYAGAGNPLIGNPTPLDADGHSLQRIGHTDDNETDFSCGDPADPTNNAGESTSLTATIRCDSVAVCTVGDCNGNGIISVDELVQGVNIALGSTPLDACPSFGANGDGAATIDEVLTAVGEALEGCLLPPNG